MKTIKTKVNDDRTMTFFWRPHTILVLLFVSLILIYVALFEKPVNDDSYNTKRGLCACAMFFVLFGVMFTPDAIFIRPHPVFWRTVFCLCILYEILLVFILFQTVDGARQLLKYVDSDLGVPLPDKDYGGNCLIYDPDVPEDPFHNFIDKLDVFVIAHFFGWWYKTIVFRDFWITSIASVMFELLEYSLEHQLPNFSECWWDHWILDVFVFNLLGIIMGVKTCNYFSMKTYDWRGMWNIPTFKGKILRAFNQFTPYSWTDYNWREGESLKRWFVLLLTLTAYAWSELGTFYLKFILWIPPANNLVYARIFLVGLLGTVAMREAFEYLDNPECQTLGRHVWLFICTLLTEVLIVFKFDWDTVTKPFPSHILAAWSVFITIIIAWTFWHFYVSIRKTKKTE